MKVTIKGIIKENRVDLLIDKIVEFLLGDTTYQVYHKFMGEIVCKIEFPMFDTEFGYSQYEIEGYLNELKESNRYNWEIPLGDYKYLDRNYGITDETIIKKIYLKYHIILFTKIINEFNDYGKTWNSINESLDNREDLLVNKISQYMLDDTEYYFHRDRVIIDYPSEGFNSYSIDRVLPLLLKRGYDINFIDYVHDTYSIKDWNLITNISQRYYSLLYDKVKELLGSPKNPMNESVGNKEDIFIDRVVESLLGDTTYEVYRDQRDTLMIGKVKYPMYEEPMIYNRFMIKSHLNYFKEKEDESERIFFYDSDYNYMDDNYSIKDETILKKIYLKYNTILLTNILNDIDNHRTIPMNESVERKEDTLNRIVDYMISDTKWDVYMEYEEDWEYVMVTMYWPGGDHEDYKTSDFEVVWEKFIMGDNDRKYLEQQFGITEEWIKQELYNRYIHKLRPIIYEEMINYTE